MTPIPPAIREACHYDAEVKRRFSAAVAEALDVPAHVQAEIDARRALAEARGFAAENRERIDAEWNALSIPPRTIAGHQAVVRNRVGEKRWREMVGEG